MTPRQLRLIRAASVSSTATLIAAVSHTLGGGAAPHPLLIVAVSFLLLPLCALLLGARRSRMRVAVAVAVAQGVFHLLFQALGSPTGSRAATPSGHAHHLDLATIGAVPLPAPSDGLMVIAHALAAVLTAVLVWNAEAIVRVVSAWFQALLRADLRLGPVEHARPAALRSIPSAPRDRAATAAVSRRGPPSAGRD